MIHVLCLTPDEISQISSRAGLLVRVWGMDLVLINSTVFQPEREEPSNRQPRVIRIVERPGEPPPPHP